MNYQYFTSESVASGHPDKICDQVSDAILDAALVVFPKSRVAVETLVTKNRVVIAGEVSCPKKLNYQKIVKRVIKNLGYDNRSLGFWYKSPIDIYIHEQSSDIAAGVDNGGAGDQGMMFGFATDETPEFMPLPIALAHKLVEKMDYLRITKILKYLKPDGKSEVKVRYEKGVPKEILEVVLAVPHEKSISQEQLKKDLYDQCVAPVLIKYGYKISLKDFIINGTGRWDNGGPAADTGLTGRKIMVDTYGAYGRQGGGCFSGKDPTKVDRSGAYAARYLAKNIIASGFAKKVEVQLAYVIGRKEPITKTIETFGSNNVAIEKIEKFAWNLLDLSVGGIIKGLKLRRPIYQKTAVYGHFGRPIFPWEKIIN